MNDILSIVLLASLISVLKALVLLTDPDNICNEMNGGTHVLPNTNITLLCDVNNTGALFNQLQWITPVDIDGTLTITGNTLSHSNSIFSSTATFNGMLINSTLTFTTIQSLDGQVVTCKDGNANSKTCTLLTYSELMCLDCHYFCLHILQLYPVLSQIWLFFL